MCIICLSVLEQTLTTKDCLHRFCNDCITTSLRFGYAEAQAKEAGHWETLAQLTASPPGRSCLDASAAASVASRTCKTHAPLLSHDS